LWAVDFKGTFSFVNSKYSHFEMMTSIMWQLPTGLTICRVVVSWGGVKFVCYVWWGRGRHVAIRVEWSMPSNLAFHEIVSASCILLNNSWALQRIHFMHILWSLHSMKLSLHHASCQTIPEPCVFLHILHTFLSFTHNHFYINSLLKNLWCMHELIWFHYCRYLLHLMKWCQCLSRKVMPFVTWYYHIPWENVSFSHTVKNFACFC